MQKETLKQFDKIILGIDPGTNVMGYGVLGVRGNVLYAIDLGAVNLHKISDTYMKLEHIYESVLAMVDSYLPDEMAVEAPFYGKNVQSMLKLGRAQGVAIAAALSRQVPISEYEPRKVKLSITGNGAATKEQVKEMLIRILGLNQQSIGPELDATDALAIALCHYYESKKIVTAGGVKSWKDYIAKNPDKVKNRNKM